jgi:hypothetical protein
MPLINPPVPEVDPTVTPLIGLPEQPSLPRAVAEKRAQKYDLAMGDDSPGPDQITEKLLTGQDQAMRDIMATRKLLQQREMKAQMLDEVAQTGGEVTPLVLDLVYNLDLEKAQIDRETAIEEAYARKALQGSLLGGFNFTAAEDEGALHTALDAAEESLTRKESFQRIHEEFQSKYENQSWLKWGGEFLGANVPFFTAAEFERVAKETLGDAGWTVGGNIDSMRDFILAQSPGVGARMVRQIAENLEKNNLANAVQFTDAMLTYSSSQQTFDSLLTLGTDVGSLAPIKIAKGLAKGAKKIKADRDAAKIVSEAVEQRAKDSRFDQVTLKEIEEIADTTTDATQVPAPERVKRSVRDVLGSLMRRESNPEDALAAAGHVEESAIVATIRNLKESIRTGLKPLQGEVGALMDNIPSIHNPSFWLGGSSKAFTREAIQKMEQSLAETTPGLLQTLVSGLRIERLPNSDEILQAMVKQARETSKLKYREVSDRIVDARPAVATTAAGDIWQVGVRWGDEAGELYSTPQAAKLAAEELGFAKFNVKQQGAKYYIETYQAVDETAPEIRSLLLTTENQTPRTFPGMFVNWLKSPEELVSASSMADRKAATFGISRLEGLVKTAAKRIGKLGKQSRDDLRTFIDNDRHWSEEITDAEGRTQRVEGRFATDLRDFETRWHSNFGRYPTENETVAYLEYVRISDLDWAFRNFRVLRDKSRLGVELQDINVGKVGDQEVFFEGVEAKVAEEIKWDKEAGILVLREGATPQFFRSNQPNVSLRQAPVGRAAVRNSETGEVHTGPSHIDAIEGRRIEGNLDRDYEIDDALERGLYEDGWVVDGKFLTREEMNARGGFATSEGQQVVGLRQQNPREYVEALKKEGYTLLRVSPFGDRTLKSNSLIRHPEGMGAVQDETIHYVLARNTKSRPLPLQQLPYRPGAHRLYSDGWYIGQPKITRLDRAEGTVHRYDYDNNIMMFGSEAKAKKFAARYETVRQMLRAGKPDNEIDAYIGANLSKSPAEIKGLFYPKLDDEGKIVAEAQLSLDDPIGARFTGTRLGDSMNLKAQYANFRNASDDEMNLYTDLNQDFVGQRNPVLETIEESGSEANPIYKTVDAKMIDVFTTLNRGVTQMFEARYLDDIKTKEIEKWVQEFGYTIKATPEELANNPTKFLYEPQWNENINRIDLAAAQNSLMSLRQFLGTQTKWSRDLQWAKQKLANAAYGAFGDKHIPIVSNFLLSTTKDPLTYIRGVAFHAKLGLFNPVQLFLQGQTYFHMAAIVGPQLALKAGPASILARMLRFTDNEKIIEEFASKAAKLGINKHDFKEAYMAMRESGIDRVGGEVAMRDTLYDPQLVSGASGKFMEWSTTFFDEGERFVRTSAYMAAYLEWRGAAGAAAKLTNAKKLELLQRADFLSGNMTRASNAAWQRGLPSLPTQFFAYQFRIMEQLLGKRLGATVQERALMRARILGTYSVLYGLPVAAGATTAVWPWTESVRKELIERGIPYDENVLTRGLVDGFASVLLEEATGLRTNIGQRYGPGGLTVLRDFYTGDKTGAELFFGVAGSTLSSMFAAAMPGYVHLRDLMMGEHPDVQLVAGDIVDFFREVSSVNNALKTIYGMNFGKYITKNEIQMTDVTPAEALALGLWGLQPQGVDDAFLKGEILKQEGEYKSSARADARKWYTRGLREDDADLAAKYFKRGQMVLEGAGLDWRERAEVFRDVARGNETYVEAMDKKFAGSSPERKEKFIKDLQEKRQTP